MVLTSKLIDGTFPDYARVIPSGNDKELVVDKKEFEQAVDRVSTVSSERGRAVKLSLSSGRLVLSVTNPDSGSATEEIEVEYASDPLDIGFNSRYLLDIASQIEGEAAVLQLSDPGSPTLIQDKDAKGTLYVLMPMRLAAGSACRDFPSVVCRIELAACSDGSQRRAEGYSERLAKPARIGPELDLATSSRTRSIALEMPRQRRGGISFRMPHLALAVGSAQRRSSGISSAAA